MSLPSIQSVEDATLAELEPSLGPLVGLFAFIAALRT